MLFSLLVAFILIFFIYALFISIMAGLVLGCTRRPPLTTRTFFVFVFTGTVGFVIYVFIFRFLETFLLDRSPTIVGIFLYGGELISTFSRWMGAYLYDRLSRKNMPNKPEQLTATRSEFGVDTPFQPFMMKARSPNGSGGYPITLEL